MSSNNQPSPRLQYPSSCILSDSGFLKNYLPIGSQVKLHQTSFLLADSRDTLIEKIKNSHIIEEEECGFSKDNYVLLLNYCITLEKDIEEGQKIKLDLQKQLLNKDTAYQKRVHSFEKLILQKETIINALSNQLMIYKSNLEQKEKQIHQKHSYQQKKKSLCQPKTDRLTFELLNQYKLHNQKRETDKFDQTIKEMILQENSTLRKSIKKAYEDYELLLNKYDQLLLVPSSKIFSQRELTKGKDKLSEVRREKENSHRLNRQNQSIQSIQSNSQFNKKLKFYTVLDSDEQQTSHKVPPLPIDAFKRFSHNQREIYQQPEFTLRSSAEQNMYKMLKIRKN